MADISLTAPGKITLGGRIDSSNAAEVEKELNGYLAGYSGELVFDAEKLEYLSSAGLRVFLRMIKTFGDVKVINVSPDVYDIFEMTGFTELMTVEKAYRRIDVTGCEIIGRGANGEVYRINPDTIVKYYMNPDSLEDIHRERELARRAFVLGIPTAIPYDVVRVGDGYGSVFEMLDAKSFAKVLAADPGRMDEISEKYASLLKTIHEKSVKPEELPDVKQQYITRANRLKDRIPDDKLEKLVSFISSIPESNHMIHGDFHLKNIMLMQGEALLIDMDTLSRGDKLFEFAGIFNAYKGYPAFNHDELKEFMGITWETGAELWTRLLADYFKGESEETIADFENKAAVIGLTRVLAALYRPGKEVKAAQRPFYTDLLLGYLDKI